MKILKTADEIKTAVDNGLTVYNENENYKVVKDKIGQYLIVCERNDYCIGLTHKDNKTLNGTKFYTA